MRGRPTATQQVDTQSIAKQASGCILRLETASESFDVLLTERQRVRPSQLICNVLYRLLPPVVATHLVQTSYVKHTCTSDWISGICATHPVFTTVAMDVVDPEIPDAPEAPRCIKG